jgi:hypothetical protein
VASEILPDPRAVASHDLVPRSLELCGDMKTDVAGCAGEENVHVLLSPFVCRGVSIGNRERSYIPERRVVLTCDIFCHILSFMFNASTL